MKVERTTRLPHLGAYKSQVGRERRGGVARRRVPKPRMSAGNVLCIVPARSHPPNDLWSVDASFCYSTLMWSRFSILIKYTLYCDFKLCISNIIFWCRWGFISMTLLTICFFCIMRYSVTDLQNNIETNKPYFFC